MFNSQSQNTLNAFLRTQASCHGNQSVFMRSKVVLLMPFARYSDTDSSIGKGFCGEPSTRSLRVPTGNPVHVKNKYLYYINIEYNEWRGRVISKLTLHCGKMGKPVQVWALRMVWDMRRLEMEEYDDEKNILSRYKLIYYMQRVTWRRGTNKSGWAIFIYHLSLLRVKNSVNPTGFSDRRSKLGVKSAPA